LDGLEAEASGMQKVAYHPDDPTAQNTSGLPNSRDLAAQLPMMEGKVEARATALYGADPTNPDRAAFARRMKQELHAKVASDVQQLNAIQRQAQGAVIDAILGSQSGTQQAQPAGTMKVGGQQPAQAMVMSFSQIQANPDLMRSWQMLDPGVKPALLNLMNRNLDPTTGDVKLYRELFNRVHLEPGDPKKVDFYKQIVDPAIADRLSMQQIQSLRVEIDRAETPGGRSPNQMRKAADANVSLFFKTNIMFTAQPERQIAATMRWNEDAAKKIDDYVAAKKDVRSLFMLDTPDSIVSQKYLQSYVNSTQAQGLAEQSAAAKAGAQQPLAQEPPVPQPTTIDTREKLDAWFQTLPPTSTTFVGTDGKIRAIPPRAAPAPGTVAYGARADGTQKGAGFLGPLVRPDGKTSTEISISTDAVGKKDFALLVPTLTKDELATILAIPVDDPKFFEKVPQSAIKKAETFAEGRIKEGKPLFAAPGEQVAMPTPPAAAAAPEDDIPKLEDAPAGSKGYRTQEQKDAQTARAEAGRAQMLGWLKSGFQAGIYVATFPLRMVARNIVQAVDMVPSEEERVASAFRSMLKKGTYRATDDTFVLLNNFIASKKGTAAENAKAQKMVKQIADRLGIEQTPEGQ
jgi:hypothetical protein